MNDTFEWNRFTKVLRKDLCNLWPTFGVTGIILAAMPFATWITFLILFHGSHIPPIARMVEIGLFTTIAGIMLPSRLYRTMNLRDSGIDFAMLPASKLEKFLSILLFSFVVGPLTVFLGSLLLDLLLTLLPFGPYTEWIWQNQFGIFWTELDDIEDYKTLSYSLFNTVMIIGTLYSISIFLFTATLFRHHKVIFTFLALYAIEFALTIIFIPISLLLLENENFGEWLFNLYEGHSPSAIINTFMGCACGFYALLTALFVALSWRRLKRMQY